MIHHPDTSVFIVTLISTYIIALFQSAHVYIIYILLFFVLNVMSYFFSELP